MLPSQSADALDTFLRARALDVDRAPLNLVIDALLDFYATVPASGLSGPDGDMLLFQYGVYDWGQGPFFQLDLTRQFIVNDDGEDEISQLHCTTYFAATDALRAIPALTAWCGSPADLPAYRQRIVASDGYRAALAARPVRRTIAWERV
jgi:hypothetical protein